MNENTKTGIYAGVALVVMLLALWVWPRTQVLVEADIVGEQLFPDYSNPSVARSMSIVIPNPATGNFEEFSVARRNGLWVVPTHGNYPVDSPERLQQAALALVDLEVIDIASEDPREHQMFGVVEPESSGVLPAVPGMGTKVVLSDEQGTRLAELIIGHAVQGSEENRFVRRPGRDAVYVVKVDIEPFATRFQDWIQSDLLELSTEEINGFAVSGHIFDRDDQGHMLPRFKIAAVAAPRPPQAPQQPAPPREWLVESFYEAAGGELQVSSLLPGEVLDSESIASMLDTVTQLQIIDVIRKPAGLAEQLEHDEFIEDVAFEDDLGQLGFYCDFVSDEDKRLVSSGSNGEVIIQTESGIEYKLSFGRPLGSQEGSSSDDVRRYMMVVARLNGDLVPLPQQLPEPTPPTPEGAPAEGETPEGEAAPAEGDATTPAGETPAAETTEEAVPAEEAAASEDDVLEGPPEGVSQEAWDAYLANLLQVRQMNQSMMDRYNAEMKASANRVRELNNRFADWFYVISEEEYDRIHLSRTELFKAGEGGMGIEEFREQLDQPLQHQNELAVPEAPAVEAAP